MKKQHTFTRKAASACLAGSVGMVMALALGTPAQATVDPDTTNTQTTAEAKLTPSMRAAQGTTAAFVQFKGQGAYEASRPVVGGRAKQNSAASKAVTDAIASEVDAKANDVSSTSNSEVLYTTHNALKGVAVEGDADSLRELAVRPDVVKVSRIVPKSRSNGGTDVDTQTLATWTNTGKTGKGVRIAVVDSGVDYTHTDFGGPGTQEAYEKASASKDLPGADSGLYDPAKFVGGYDFAGDQYDAGDPEKSTPNPDNNPLDCREGGHGSHVAGTTAGYGVTEDGKTFRGDYNKLTAEQVKKMKIGPGSAPEAEILGFRVFGCEGTTNVVGEALDRVLDPNSDGDFSDRANIVNLSLGSDFGVIDDPENDIIEALNRQGVLSVIAAGNANNYHGVGDTYSNLGNPPNAISALTVANSIGSTFMADKEEISSSTYPKTAVTGDYSRAFDYSKASPQQLTGTVVAAPEDNRFACEAFPEGTNFAGKWVLIDWYDENSEFPCGSKVRFDNIEKAGGKGVVLTSDRYTEDSGIAGNETIPGVRLNVEDSKKLREALQDGPVKITLKNEWIESQLAETHALDTLNSSTARGPHGSNGFTKPDVAAPGTNIVSVGVGKGNGTTIMSGTSMATPHVAGIAALVLEAHQNYTPANIKAAIMNTATHDLKTASGKVFAVDRVGSGRVDAQAAVNDNVLLYNSDNPNQVSQSFGVVEVKPTDGALVLQRKFTVDNFSGDTHTYAIGFDQSVSMPGVTITADPTVTVGGGSKAEFTVTATVDPSALEKIADPALEQTQLDIARYYIAQASGRIKLTEGSTELRVPVQIAPKPVSDMSATINADELKKVDSSAKVQLTGTELNQGGYEGLLGAFQLGAESPRLKTTDLPVPSMQRIDLQYVGASSNAPALTAAGQSTDDAVMGFGISTWANWDVIAAPNFTEVSIDVDGNGRADFFLATDRTLGLDLPLANLYGYVNGEIDLLASQPINGAEGNVDTNLMDTNTMVLPVKLSDLGVTAENADKVSYKVDTYSWYSDSPVDSTDWITYNPIKPALWFDGAEQATDVLYKDTANNGLTAHRGSEEKVSALFLHTHNGSGDLTGKVKGEDGAKAQVVTLSEGEPASEPTPQKPEFDPHYTDVKKDHPYFKEIAWATQKHLVDGYPDGSFKPEAQLDRATFAAYLYHLAGSPQYTAPTQSKFKDVAPTDKYFKEISWASSHGLLSGGKNGNFEPNATVSNAAVTAVLYRAAGSPEYSGEVTNRFSDVKKNTQYAKEISWAAEHGIAVGKDGKFAPYAPVTRAEIAGYLYRYGHMS